MVVVVLLVVLLGFLFLSTRSHLAQIGDPDLEQAAQFLEDSYGTLCTPVHTVVKLSIRAVQGDGKTMEFFVFPPNVFYLPPCRWHSLIIDTTRQICR